MPFYTVLFIEFLKFIPIELSTSIYPEHLYFLLSLIIHKNIKLLKFTKDLKFISDNINPSVPQEIIYE
jgi:hypothetical protein